MSDAEISDSAARAAHVLRAGVGRLRRRFRAATQAHELTPSQSSVLGRLSRTGAITASELADAEHVRPQSAAAWIAALEEQGLVERRRDPSDGRRQLVSLTAQGHEFVAGARRSGEEWLARALQDRFTEEERRRLTDAMTLLLERLELP